MSIAVKGRGRYGGWRAIEVESWVGDHVVYFCKGKAGSDRIISKSLSDQNIDQWFFETKNGDLIYYRNYGLDWYNFWLIYFSDQNGLCKALPKFCFRKIGLTKSLLKN